MFLPPALLVTALWLSAVDNGLPENVTPGALYSAIDSPRLEFSLYRGQLKIDGHTTSRVQEKRLLQSATRLFSGAPESASFKPLGVAPDDWEVSSMALLKALSGTQSAHALLVDDTIRIRGVGKPNWSDSERQLRAALPASVGVDVDMIITDDSVNLREFCARAFAKFRNGAINFQESTTLLRESALPALNRVVSLADACRRSVISITGHTDSSGPEVLNRELSLARAVAVADFLEDRGIRRARLKTVGAGSSQPLATNVSRYGRGINRRIEIRFRHSP